MTGAVFDVVLVTVWDGDGEAMLLVMEVGSVKLVDSTLHAK